jgi:glycosyltransferase involved in cell wall biosynthesis
MQKISVCLATYNGQAYIKEQIESILRQLSISDEILISDDGSTDETVSIIENIGDARISVIKSEGHKGLLRNIETALVKATGNYIFLADQDDVWIFGKVKSMVAALDLYHVVVCDCSVTDANLNVIHPSFFHHQKSRSGLLKNLWRNSYIGCCMAMRRGVLDKAIPFPKDTPMHDWWIGLVGEAAFSTKFISDPLVFHRRHGKNLSLTAQGSSFSILRKLRWRMILVKNLIHRLYFT